MRQTGVFLRLVGRIKTLYNIRKSKKYDLFVFGEGDYLFTSIFSTAQFPRVSLEFYKSKFIIADLNHFVF